MKVAVSCFILLGLHAVVDLSSGIIHDPETNHSPINAAQYHSMPGKEHLEGAFQGALFMSNATLKNDNFGFNLYRLIANEHDDNVFFSPLCVSFALASMLLGTKGVTRDEILQSMDLHLLQDKDQPNLVPTVFKRIKDLITHNQELMIDQGNVAFIHEQFPVKESFLNMSKQYFDMEVLPVDFQNSTIAKDIVNQYIRKFTGGKIPKLYDSLDPQTKYILINYILFKGMWLYPFNKAFTEPTPFFINKYKKIKVPMMFKADEISSTVDKKLRCTVLKLPYRGNAAMLVVLPREEGDYGSIEDNLTGDLVQSWLAKMETRKTFLFFPKFTLDHRYEMGKLLQELGIQDLFSGSANFTELTDQRNMRLSEVTQRAMIEVNEKGTEASVVTGSEIVGHALPTTIRVERPFIFIIIEELLNSILFIGRVVNPIEQ
ncbi:protein Z-dependent protease inhibitor [Pleurodeles waltl]|uniref:protein Z-dependent protease inhibitor n=1 Tax=Pleurodeles waltl TaxID=8319 RepID=UPI0037094017